MKYICWDCKKELLPDEEFMSYQGDFIKCKACTIADPVLRNFQPTECYSRVVGYIRPVSAWNVGKQQEMKDRKVFKI